jgi:prefoldin subunit 5
MNKQSSNKLAVCGIVISIIALLICFVTIGLWIFEVAPKSIVTIDAFMGVCVTVMSVIVTIAIGWQIFNVVEVRNTMRFLEEKQKKVDELHEKLEKKIRYLEYDFDEMKHHTLHLHAVTLALHVAIEKKYDEACYHFMVALTESVQLRKPLNVNEVLNYFQKYLGFITTTVLMSKDEMEEFREMDKIIRRSEQYRLFGRRYEEISGRYFAKMIEKK